MKNVKLNIALIGLTLIGLTSCDREDSGFGNGAKVTENEAVELLQQTLVSEAYGIDIQANDASGLVTEEASKSAFVCGVLNERTMERNSSIGAVTTFSHSIDYNFTLICDNEIPRAYSIDFDGSGTYSSPRLESNDVISYNAVLDDILVANTPYVYNSSFMREGTQTTRINGNTKDFESTLIIESTNIAIDKITRIILSGNATFSLAGTLTTGEPFSYRGDIIFNGNGNATIEVNGNIYNVQL